MIALCHHIEGILSMPAFFISDVKQVRELNQQAMVNKHINAGWILLSAVTAPSNEPQGVVTRYILGWLSDDVPLQHFQY